MEVPVIERLHQSPMDAKLIFEIVNPPQKAYKEAARPLFDYNNEVSGLMRYVNISTIAEAGSSNIELAKRSTMDFENVQVRLKKDEIYGVVREADSNKIIGGVALHIPGLQEFPKSTVMNEKNSLASKKPYTSMVELTHLAIELEYRRRGAGKFAVYSVLEHAQELMTFDYAYVRTPRSCENLFRRLGFEKYESCDGGSVAYLLDMKKRLELEESYSI